MTAGRGGIGTTSTPCARARIAVDENVLLGCAARRRSRLPFRRHARRGEAHGTARGLQGREGPGTRSGDHARAVSARQARGGWRRRRRPGEACDAWPFCTNRGDLCSVFRQRLKTGSLRSRLDQGRLVLSRRRRGRRGSAVVAQQPRACGRRATQKTRNEAALAAGSMDATAQVTASLSPPESAVTADPEITPAPATNGDRICGV